MIRLILLRTRNSFEGLYNSWQLRGTCFEKIHRSSVFRTIHLPSGFFNPVCIYVVWIVSFLIPGLRRELLQAPATGLIRIIIIPFQSDFHSADLNRDL